jgi:hypothetical protein
LRLVIRHRDVDDPLDDPLDDALDRHQDRHVLRDESDLHSRGAFANQVLQSGEQWDQQDQQSEELEACHQRRPARSQLA